MRAFHDFSVMMEQLSLVRTGEVCPDLIKAGNTINSQHRVRAKPTVRNCPMLARPRWSENARLAKPASVVNTLNTTTLIVLVFSI